MRQGQDGVGGVERGETTDDSFALIDLESHFIFKDLVS